jgi:hypothetical protein
LAKLTAPADAKDTNKAVKTQKAKTDKTSFIFTTSLLKINERFIYKMYGSGK